MKVGLLFPGQGSQKVGMGLDLYEAYPAARAVFDLADDTLGFWVVAIVFRGPRSGLDRHRQCPAGDSRYQPGPLCGVG